MLSFLAAFALIFSSSLIQAQQLNPTQDFHTSIKPQKVAEKAASEIEQTRSEHGTATMTVLINEYAFPYDITDDAKHITIIGFGDGISYYWSSEEGLQPITGMAYGLSNDIVVAGYYTNPDITHNGENVVTAGTWSKETSEWTFLGYNPTHPDVSQLDYNSAWGIDASGNTIVGLQFYDGFSYSAFKWTNSGGYEMIGDPSSEGSRPNGISGDGSLIFGWADKNNTGRTPIIWHDDEFIYIDDNQYGEAFAASADGFYVTGVVGENAFLWQNDGTDATQFSNSLNDGSMSTTAVMSDGTIMGFTNEFWPPFPDTRVAFVRHTNGAMESFNDYAEARGMTDAQAWTFYSISAVTPDGNNFVGAAIDPQGNSISFLLSFQEETLSYELSLDVEPVEGGSVTGAGTYPAGTMVEIEANPNANYTFENWTDELGNIISDAAAYTLEMPENDLTITANFAAVVNYNLSIQVAPENAGTASGAGTYPAGTMVVIEASANTDYAFVNWTDAAGNIVSDSPMHTVEMPENDLSLTANFVFVGTFNLSILIDPVEGGTATGEGDYIGGTWVEIEAIPNTNYAFINWTDSEGNIISDNQSYSLTMPENDLALTANFLNTVGLESNTENSFRVYPNPANQQLKLVLKENSGILRLFDASGRLVLQKVITQSTEKIDISALNNGIYKAVVSTNSNSYFQQIIVVR